MDSVFVIRISDCNAHEGDDGLYAIFNDGVSALEKAEQLNDEAINDRQTRGITHYVEEWVVW